MVADDRGRLPGGPRRRRGIAPVGAARPPGRVLALLEGEPVWARDFFATEHEWRRLFAEALGTFLLVLTAAGGAVLDVRTGGGVGRTAAVTAPGLTVAAVILATGAVSGAHLNPAVTLAFALRRDFPWGRVPGYVLAQLAGASLASLALLVAFGPADGTGTTVPGLGLGGVQATFVESVLTFGLVTVILGTASTAQNIGSLSAVAVGGYIVAAGLWASPATGASMNPARSFGPALVAGRFGALWVYVVGPVLGALAAVAAAYALRGRGGDPGGTRAAQGSIEADGS